MKRLKSILLILALSLCLAIPAWAASVATPAVDVPWNGGDRSQVGPITMHNGVLRYTGNSGIYILPGIMHRYTWTVALSAAPASASTTFHGSLDGIFWDILDTNTSVATMSMRHIVDKPVRYLRSNVADIGAGPATATITFSGMKD